MKARGAALIYYCCWTDPVMFLWSQMPGCSESIYTKCYTKNVTGDQNIPSVQDVTSHLKVKFAKFLCHLSVYVLLHPQPVRAEDSPHAG